MKTTSNEESPEFRRRMKNILNWAGDMMAKKYAPSPTRKVFRIPVAKGAHAKWKAPHRNADPVPGSETSA